MRTVFRRVGLVWVVVFGLVVPSFAQQAPEVIELDEEAPPGPSEKPSRGQLEEIIVTSQRRVSSLQDTPISIEAFGAEKMELRGIGGVEDLRANVPSMVVEPFPLSATTLRISIRGVGVNESQVTQDPAVGIYVDGVYLARNVGLAMDLADVERMEVLRGPQGVLYGRNSTGGAVNIISRRPDPGGLTMQHKLTLGQRNLLMGKSVLNLPLSEDAAIKFAFLGRHSGGFVENTGAGEDFGDRDALGLRFDARWFAAPTLTVDYGYDYTDLSYVNYLFQAQLTPETHHGLAEYFKRFAQAHTIYSDRRLHRLATGAPMQASQATVSGHTLSIAKRFGALELKYLGSLRTLEDFQYPDLGGGAGSTEYRLDTGYYDSAAAREVNGGEPTPLVIPRTFQDQWSHELQISGSAFDNRLDFIGGLYYFGEKGGENGGPVHHILSATVDPQEYDSLMSLSPELEQLAESTTDPRLSAYWDYLVGIENAAYAAYSQIGWRPDWLDRRLNVTLGMRISRDERWAIKDFIQTQWAEWRAQDGSLAATPVPQEAAGSPDEFIGVEAATEYSDFSPALSVQFDVTDLATTYVSYATAYKSGGFNTRDPQISGASGAASDGETYGFGFVEGFAPERVKSLELGIKSEWLDRALRLNGALFFSRFEDMQTNFLIAGTIADTKARNAGKARMNGLELEGAFIPAPGLVLGFQYAYLDAEVTEVIDINGDNVAHLYPFVAAPPWSGVASVDWTVSQRGWGDLRAYLSANYMGERMGLVISEPRRGLTTLDGYWTVNARLMLSQLRAGAGGTLDIALWGQNLLDEEYPLSAIDNLPQADRAVVWGEPRRIGLDFIYRYE